MSRALPVSERAPLDFYATPEPLALAICRHLRESVGNVESVIEPSAGHGPFVRAARVVWPGASVVAVDLSPERLPALSESGAEAVFTMDWLDYVREPRHGGPPVLVVGNPPFRDAEEHVRASLAWMENGDTLAFLLRLNFLGSVGRLPLWSEHRLAEVVPLVPRPSFTGGGSDATEYALFVWRKGYAGTTELHRPLRWTGAA